MEQGSISSGHEDDGGTSHVFIEGRLQTSARAPPSSSGTDDPDEPQGADQPFGVGGGSSGAMSVPIDWKIELAELALLP